MPSLINLLALFAGLLVIESVSAPTAGLADNVDIAARNEALPPAPDVLDLDKLATEIEILGLDADQIDLAGLDPDERDLIGRDPIELDDSDIHGHLYDDSEEDSDIPNAQIHNATLMAATAKSVTLDCTGFEELCDANCYAILCLDQPNVLTKVNNVTAQRHRRQNGAARQPFKGTQSQLNARGLRRPGDLYVSAEEYPFASSAQGGTGADLFPAIRDHQNKQGSAIGLMYRNNGIADGDTYNLAFNANTPYCNALRDGDYSVCNTGTKDPGPGGFDTGYYAFVRNSLKNQKLHFSFVGK